MQVLGSIRNIKDSELELMLSWRNAPATRKNMYTSHIIEVEEHVAWWERTKADPRHCYFMYEQDGQPLGIVGLNNIDLVNKNSAWAFYSSPEAPRGTGSRMEYLALEYAFGELALYKLYCEVLAFNESVIKLHQKFGFKVEGVFRDQHMTDEGFVDIYRLGLLASEWIGMRESMYTKLSRLIKK